MNIVTTREREDALAAHIPRSNLASSPTKNHIHIGLYLIKMDNY